MRRAQHKTWSRSDGKRLKRSESPTPYRNVALGAGQILGVPLIHEVSGPSLYHYDEIRDQHITQHYVTSRNKCFDIKLDQTSAFCRLPEEVMMMIFDYLSYSDIISMATSCKSIAEFVNRNFVPSVTLPLSSQNLRKLDGRQVLYLKSTFNIMKLQKYKKGEYLKNLSKIQLSRLQKLVFVLYEHSDENTFPYDHILPPLYKDILNHYLSTANQLTHLHIAIDRSEETFKIIDVISKSFSCLSKVVLQATNTPNNVPFPIECEASQEMKRSAHELQMSSLLSYFLTLNELLERLLRKPSIKSLEILGLYLAQNWDGALNVGENYPLVIRSDNLQYLRIEQDAFCYISCIECPELLELTYIDLGGENFQKLECLIHHDAFDGGYKTMLTSGCPRLERLNDIDIKSLRNRLTGRDPFEEWHVLLESVCNCEIDDENEVEVEDDF